MELNLAAIERRRAIRISTSRRGFIKFGARGQDVCCTVHDLSSDGAGLSVASVFGLPNSFALAIDGEKVIRYCRVAWIQGKKLGVAFV
jgi:PilZ domain